MRTRLFSVVPALLAALGILPLLAIVLKRGVEVPYWDEWEWVDLIYAAHNHTLTFDQMWLPHNEHRILIPNLLMVGLDRIGGWGIVREQVVSLAVLALTQLFVWLIIRRTVRRDRAGICFFIATAVLLGLSQYENLQWGFQMAWFICDLGLVGAVWALTKPHRTPRDVFVAILFALLASLSSSQGLLVWVAGLVAIVLVPRRVIPTAIGWLTVAGVVIAIVRFGSPGEGGPGHVGFSHVALLAHYAAIYLGAPIAASRGLNRTAIAGCVLVIWLAVLAVAAMRSPLAMRVRVAPWLAIALYPVICAVITASGRAGFGLSQAASSRYTSIGALAWVAAVAATFVLVPRVRLWPLLVAVPAAIVLVASAEQDIFGNNVWHQHTVEMRDARAGLASADPSRLKLIYPDSTRVTVLLRELATIRDGVFIKP
ncbi:MAG: hypothetical protein JWO66_292 [Candidatus Eremiobacteraeota bacterium]|nr:hypothetical protein [Candidatus Eremiobacteraeota bacterium]